MLNVVVTGGGTIAPIDDVRHIANVSTGRFSAQITEAFLRRGAYVCHLFPQSAVLPFEDRAQFDLVADFDEEVARMGRLRAEFDASDGRYGGWSIVPPTVAKYAETLRACLTMRPIDIAVLAMAVSDYEPEPVAGKVASDCDEWTLTLRRTPKVIRHVREWSSRTFLVGFKLLSGVTEGELIEAAREACITNDADLTIANDLQLKNQFLHTVHVVSRAGLIETIGPKGPIADRLVDRIIASYQARATDRADQ